MKTDWEDADNLLRVVPRFTLWVLFSQREHLTSARLAPINFKDGQNARLGLVGSRSSGMGLDPHQNSYSPKRNCRSKLHIALCYIHCQYSRLKKDPITLPVSSSANIILSFPWLKWCHGTYKSFKYEYNNSTWAFTTRQGQLFNSFSNSLKKLSSPCK